MAAIISLAVLLGLATSSCSTSVEAVKVPIEVRGADSVGAIAFALLYDPTILEYDSVDAGDLAKDAEAGYSLVAAGRLVIAVKNAPSIIGDGTLMIAGFKVIDRTRSTALTIEVIEARQLGTLQLLTPQASPGSFAAGDMAVVPPVIIF